MGGIYGDSVHPDMYEGVHAVQEVGSNPDGSPYDQAPVVVFAGNRVVLHLHDVLVGDEAYQYALLVHDGQFLNLIALQDFLGFLQGSPNRGRHEVATGHNLRDGAVQVCFKAEVAVRQDTGQTPIGGDNGDTADFEAGHQLQGIGHARIGRKGDGINDHPTF